jgi:beta-glucosidase
MMKKIVFMGALLAAGISAQSYSGTYPYIQTLAVLDTVFVPVKIMKLESITAGVYDYSGQVTYDIRVGLNDSLNISLDFVPVGGGTAITPYQVDGMVGTKGFLEVNGIGGTNVINFRCQTTGAPTGCYTARITVVANPTRIEKTVDSLLALMTNAEKVTQLAGSGSLGSDGGRDSPDVTRLGIPGYHMSNGPQQPCVGSSGNATAFASPSAMSCTFDTALIKQCGVCLAKEYWAKGKFILEGPVMTLVSDPRVGRAFETFSEDPYLGAMMAYSYVKGVQSLGVVTTCKHFVCNEVETARQTSSSNVCERSLREMYCMPFEYAIKDGKALAVMVAYNMVNGTYCTQNPGLLTNILKYNWGHRGYALSDWGAMHSTAAAANAGHDVELVNNTYFGTALLNAVGTGSVSQARLDDMARRILRNKIFSNVLGKLTAASRIQYAADLMSAAHKQTCLDIGHESIVLVKNDNSTLPLNATTLTSIAVVGTYASTARLSGGGSGGATCALTANTVTPLQGITTKVGAGKIAATWNTAEVVVVMVGVSGEAEGSDRSTLAINNAATENTLVTNIVAAGKKCIVVVTGGSAASQDVWFNAPAVLVAWYPGENQGTALADIIFGDVNPSGRLSASWPVNNASLPTFTPTLTQIPYPSPDTGVGYRWYDRTGRTPFLAFGHGLSYTTFAYSNLRFNKNPAYAGEDVVVTATITNTGTRAGQEVAQLYLTEQAPLMKRPVKELRGFTRVTLNPAEAKDVSFKLRPREFAYYDSTAGVKRFIVQPDAYTIRVGPSSANLPLSATLTLLDAKGTGCP